jgi:5-methyltetrahydrofolate--homocysteine methyltransferase
MADSTIARLTDLVLKGDEAGVGELVEELLVAGTPPEEILEQGLFPGLTALGAQFEAGEVFLPELITAAEVAKQVLARVEPLIASGRSRRRGTIVVGTVSGDAHDIGMGVVAAMFRGAGYEVVNLGNDVSAMQFTRAVEKHGADALAMSSLVTTTMPYMKTVVDALQQTGLRDRVKVLVGGAPLDDAFAARFGADGYGRNAQDGIEKLTELLAVDAGSGT